MCRVYVVVEGYTERAVIQEVLAPDLANQGIFLFPRIIGKPGKKGGNCKFERVLPEICNLLRQESNTFVTTFFDYYALPNDWPNREDSYRVNWHQQKADIIEAEFKKVVLEQLDHLDPNRFIPYIQMYELEALLFSDSTIMGEILNIDRKIFQEILDDFDGQCEAINDSNETAPSKRIMQIVHSYKKGSSVNAHGWRILKQIGMPKIREKCPRFNNWIQSIENLKRITTHKPPKTFEKDLE